MGGMKDLFGDTPYVPRERETGLARSTDPDTAHEAAARIDATDLELRVLKVVARYGPPGGLPMCVVEVHARLSELSIDTVSPRMH